MKKRKDDISKYFKMVGTFEKITKLLFWLNMFINVLLFVNLNFKFYISLISLIITIVYIVLMNVNDMFLKNTAEKERRKSFLKEDIYIPNSKEPCSLEDSWVKVKRVDGEYKYYTYLKCGIRQSNVDHEGPKIELNGKKEITITRGGKYKEQGPCQRNKVRRR